MGPHMGRIPSTRIGKELLFMNRKALIGIGVLAGVAQAFAGAAMYLAGVYFAPWSMLVTLVLLVVCIVVG
jgi:hypothetical protein